VHNGIEYADMQMIAEVYGIMRDARAWKSIRSQRPDQRLVTLREVALALEMYDNSVAGKATEVAKQAFGEQAEAVGLRKKENLDDEIPW
jgi:6-phosphogluconate dehydrogenase (decarboxylating)